MAPVLVTASIRRTLEPVEDSETILNNPSSAVLGNVGAAAQLAGEGLILDAHGHDANHVAVLLTKKRHGAGGLGLLNAHDGGHHGLGGKDLLVDQVFHRADLLSGHGLEVREVKAQALGRHQRTGLVDVVAQDLLQGGVEQVGGGVVATEQTAAGEVVTDKDGVTLRKRADELALMDVQTALGDSVIDEELSGRRCR